MATAIPVNEARFTLGRVANVTGGALEGPADTATRGVCTDTRADLRGQLFVALRGERFDGHEFIGSALQAGAAGVVAETLPPGVPGVRVESALDALGALARDHRRAWGGRVVAVAGSAGKTTTRSVTGALLERLLGDRVHLTKGNLNNLVGVPMVLFGATASHDLAVIEVGTNQTGEVASLESICEPDVALLTLIDLEHAEGLGDLDAIEIEEGAILRPSAKLLLGNGDDQRVRRQIEAAGTTALLYGFGETCDYRILSATLTQDCSTRLQIARPDASKQTLLTPFLGAPGALATLAAIAVAEHFAGRALDPAWVEHALGQPGAREPGRLQPLALADGTLVIDDSYNANPASLLAAIAVARQVADLRRARLHLVLGEMRELGAWSESEHRKLRSAVEGARAVTTAAIGPDARWFVGSAEGERHFADSVAAAAWLSNRVAAGDVVLVKASRGIRAEMVVDTLVRERGDHD